MAAHVTVLAEQPESAMLIKPGLAAQRATPANYVGHQIVHDFEQAAAVFRSPDWVDAMPVCCSRAVASKCSCPYFDQMLAEMCFHLLPGRFLCSKSACKLPQPKGAASAALRGPAEACSQEVLEALSPRLAAPRAGEKCASRHHFGL